MQEQQLVLKKKYRRKFFDIKDGYSLVKFINKIPRLEQIKFKLSQQQCNVVGQNENLIVIGRSGTGKTTCALMRMFSIQILYKDTKAKENHLALGNNDKFYLKSKFIDQVYGIHNIFLTASPLLINEICNKYGQLKRHLKKQLDILENRKNIISNDSPIQPQEVCGKFDMNGINNAEEAEVNRENKFNTFHNLTQEDFPGFFTVKEFLVMLDGILINSFFVRNTKRQRIVNAKDVEVDNDKKMHKIQMKNKKYFAKECKWQTFSSQFWNKDKVREIIKARKKYEAIEIKDITAITVWTEILSAIKGDFTSHTYPEGYLPRKQYLELRKNKLLKRQQKQIIFDIFVKYQQWKNHSETKYYDFLDLSNHLLSSFKLFFQYSNQEHIFCNEKPVQFHYLFLDQIQDLPPVVPYLISQIFTDGLYFSGDSAQAIQKGIAFKFSDLKFMFHRQFQKNNKQCPPLFFQQPKIHKLTVNFRSHQNILKLANCLIGMLQKLFPDSIDRLQKEQSPLKGPKPIYLTFQQMQEAIHRILLQNNSKTLQCNSAIIVRNVESKQTLPEGVRNLKGIVLTIEQAKGMEFDDVIMYNFFNPKLTPLWKVLKYLQIFPQKGQRRHIQQIEINDYEELITQIKLVYTLVTRAKCTLLICQDNIPKELLLILQTLNLIGTFKNILETRHQKDLYKSKMQKSQREITWQERGYAFYIQKKYDLALQCYQNANIPDVCKKIKGIQNFESANIELKRIRQAFSAQKYESEYSQKQLFEHPHYVKYKKQCQIVYKKFYQAGEFFENAKALINAGHAYYLGCHYEKALQNYLLNIRQQNYYKIATCYRKSLKEPLKQNLKKSVSYYRKSQEYSQMVQVLQQIGDSGFSLRQISKCQNFKQKQFYYRKYARLFINKKYEQIDNYKQFETKQKMDFDFSSNESNFCIYKCLFEIQNAKLKLSNNKSIMQLQPVEKQIKIFAAKCKQQLEKNIQYEKIVHFKTYTSQLQLKINQIIERMPMVRNQYERSTVREQIQINRQICEESKKCLMKAQKQFQAVCSKIAIPQKIISKSMDILRNIQTFVKVQFLQYAKILLISLGKLTFIRQQSENIMKSINTQLKDGAYKKLKELASFIQEFKLDLLSITKQKIKSQAVFKNLEKYITINRLSQYKTVINNYKQQFFNRFYHLINQQHKKSFELIYDINLHLPQQTILLHSQKHILLQEQKILQVIIQSKYLIELKNFSNEKLLPVEKRRQLQAKQSKLLSFRFINHIAIQRECNSNPQKHQLAFKIKFLDGLLPRAVITLSTLLNIRQKAVQGFIGELSYHSTCYSKKSTYSSAKNAIISQQPQILKLINPSFFNFQMYRTIQRLQSSKNELIQAVILLGFHQKFERFFSQTFNLKLWLAYMDQNKVARYMHKNYRTYQLQQNIKRRFYDDYQYQKQWKNDMHLDKQTLDNLKSFILINQYFQMDKYEESPWFGQKIQRQYERLRNESIKEEGRKVIQQNKKKIKSLASSFEQQMRFNISFIKLYNRRYKIQNLDITSDIIEQYKIQIPIYNRIIEEGKKKILIQMKRYISSVANAYHIIKIINEVQGHRKDKDDMHFNEIKNVCTFNYCDSAQIQQSFKQQFVNKLQPLLNITQIFAKTQEIFMKIEFLQPQLLFQQFEKNTVYLQYMNEIKYASRQINIIKDNMGKLQQLKSIINKIQNFIINFPKSSLSSKKYDDIKRNYCYSNITIKRIFFSQNPTQLMDHFNYLCSNVSSKQNRISILLFYVSFNKYKNLSKIINRNIQGFTFFKDNLMKITNILLNPLANYTNFQYYLNLLEIFRIRPVSNCYFMSIFQNLVIVDRKLIQILKIKSNFCYKMQEKGQKYLMRFSQISKIMSQTLFKDYFQLQNGRRYSLPLITDIDFLRGQILKIVEEKLIHLTANQRKLLQVIHKNKQQLISFYYQHQFISHESFLFVYSQLKNYYDLIVIIKLSKTNQNVNLQNQLLYKIRLLQKEFKDWKIYAQLEIKKEKQFRK